jgi:hypothetical protein
MGRRPSSASSDEGGPPSSGDRVALATRHGKEAVVFPVLRELVVREHGCTLVHVELDTDRFGTFTRTVPRAGTQLEVARAKARAALQARADAAVGLASEGSFGPHPGLPWLSAGLELLVWLDARGVEVVGRDRTLETNHAQREVTSLDEAHRFAQRIGWPEHALVVRASADDPHPELGVRSPAALERAVEAQLRARGRAWLEADMRAMMNPTRMRSIERAARDLAARLACACPRCGEPGFGDDGVTGARPCAGCGEPTTLPSHRRLRCPACAHEERQVLDDAPADPGHCPRCNP